MGRREETLMKTGKKYKSYKKISLTTLNGGISHKLDFS